MKELSMPIYNGRNDSKMAKPHLNIEPPKSY